MQLKEILKLLGFILLCEIIGSIGSIATIPNIPAWYIFLVKPFFAPPNWLFAPVWTLLFALMGIALFIVWEKKEKKFIQKRKNALNIFTIQFALNVLWSFLFFGLRSPLLGFVGIVLLWISIVATIISFYKISKKAAYLLVPYLLWVSFASILNLAIMLLNP